MDEFDELRRAIEKSAGPVPPPPRPGFTPGMSDRKNPSRYSQETGKAASSSGWNPSKRNVWLGIGILGIVLLFILVTNAHHSARMREAAAKPGVPAEAPVNGGAGRAQIDEVNQRKALTPAPRRQAREERQARIRRMRTELNVQAARTRCRQIWDATATKPIAELTPPQTQMIDLCQAAGLYPPP